MWGRSFSGIALPSTGWEPPLFSLACQPCICYFLPINGSRGSNRLICSLSLSLFPCSDRYSLIAFVFSPRCPHNIPCTKILGFGMQTSSSPIFERLAAHFFLSNILSIPKRSFLAGYSPAYGWVLALLHTLSFLPLSINTVALRFPWLPGVFLPSSPSVCISAQMLSWSESHTSP